ncbi:MAG: NAD(P)/FAD-dependent oxidoreductase [bacterium]|nr:NAD(P)/FAD-dependent oxidoreductase [bacterium]
MTPEELANNRIIVIGGGPAGMMAAGQAASEGANCILLEKMSIPGRKLSITGKGRCNLTNIAELPEFISRFGKNGRFLRQAFHRFFAPDTIEFFGQLGVDIKTERGGRVFPVNDNAPGITEAMIRWLKKCGVTIKANEPALGLLIENDSIVGVRTERNKYRTDRVILATGALSYPATGSTGDGYRFSKSAGHNLIPTRPALVPLITTGEIARKLQGVSLRNVSATLWIDGKRQAERFGEMLFTHFGLSGPIILSISSQAVDALNRKRRVEIAIDLKPALDNTKLDNRLLREIQSGGKRKFQTMLKSLLPSGMIPLFCELTGIEPDKAANQLSGQERKKLRDLLKSLRLTVSGHRSYNESIITAGGINTKEIDPRTMESRLVRGLYFAGELIDIDGDTGGYNLQAAFSTGWLAGRSAIASLLAPSAQKRPS